MSLKTLLLLSLVLTTTTAIAQRREATLSMPSAPRGVMPGSVESSPAQLDARGPVYIENKGQWDPRVRFLLRSGGLDTWITDRGVVYDLYAPPASAASASKRSTALLSSSSSKQRQEMTRHGHVVSIDFEGSSFAPTAHGLDRRAGAHNYFIGNDRSKWATNVGTFGQVEMKGIYRGIDAVFYLDGGRPRYDLVIAPGADASQVRMRIDGASGVGVTSTGSLTMTTSMGAIEQRGLYAYQEIGRTRKQVKCGFVVDAKGSVRFDVGSYDRTRPLVIDPLVYATYLGGNAYDSGMDIEVDGSGNAYVFGVTHSRDFPTTTGAYQTSKYSFQNAFVSKLNATGSSLIYSTYIGGSCDVIPGDLALDGNGNVYITGQALGPNFPMVNAYQSTHGGASDVFLVKLNSSGTDVTYSTYLGGSSFDRGNAIAVDDSGYVYIAGETESAGFPVTSGAYQDTLDGKSDAYLVKFNPSASALVYSTLIGGSNEESAMVMGVGANSSVYIAGYSKSADYPTTSGAFQTTRNGLVDLFVARIDGGASLGYSTFLGGSYNDYVNDMAVDGNGSVYLAGMTMAGDFPTTSGAFQTTFGGFNDAYVLKLDSNGSLGYSTFLGGSSGEESFGVEIDADGNAYVVGYTASATFPLVAPYQSSLNGTADLFIAKLGDGGNRLLYSTFLGGSGFDQPSGVALGAGGNVYLVGFTSSLNFPTTVGAYQPTYNVLSDNIILQFTVPSVEVTSPNDGEHWCAGSGNAINWSSIAVTDVKIELSSDGGVTFPTTIVSSTPAAAGTYNWTIPTSQAHGTNYRIRISDASNSALVDASNASFTIDNAAPVPNLATLPTIMQECSATLTPPTAADACSGTITATTSDPLTYSTQGTYTVHWTYQDGNGNTTTQNQTVIVDDITAPSLTVSLTPTILWPPNNQMRTIAITASTSDNCGSSSWVLTSVTGDDGTVSGDISAATETAASSVSLRAKRTGGGGGRTYTLLFTADDGHDNQTTVTRYVYVPHSQPGRISTGASVDAAELGFSSAVAPNPFTTMATIGFELKESASVKVTIYDERGKEVAVVMNDELSKGAHDATWSGTTRDGQPASSGRYYYRIESNGTSETGSIVLMK